MSDPRPRRRPRKNEVLQILEAQGVHVRGLGIFKGSSEKEIIDFVAANLGGIPCGNYARCGTVITRRKDCVRDHKIALRLAPDGADYDTPENQWYLCLACNSQKTYGRGLGPIYGSDAMRNAKLRRVEKGGRKKRSCRKIQSRPWPKTSFPFPIGKRKIPSRPFSSKHGPK